ncbi:MAG: hypothetical protein SH818_19295 [Saprospiraceae bacterium]|nr:hypothetical protein [Saprospiraceae bacterium]
MKKLFTLFGFIQFVFLNPILAQIPGTINVQGVLTNASGQIVSNGNYSITFRLYASAQDATVLWEEKQDNLNVQGGVFSASLGKIKPFTLPFDKTYFLGLQIGLEAELAPRIEMTSTPYSMMAKSVENNSITAAKIQNNAVTADKIVPPIVSSLNGIINDGGDIKLKPGKNIEVTPDPIDKSISISVTGLDTVSNDMRYVNENQTNVIGPTMIKDNAVSVEKIIPNVVSSINGVNNDGGNINIVAGANITILNNDQENTITISAVNPGNTNPGIGKINAGNGIAVAGSDGPTAVISVSPNSLTDTEIMDKSLTAISLANGAVGTNEIQTNAVTIDKITPNVLSSISGISNDGGNINLVAGNNVTIVPNDANKTITISASGTGGGTSNFTQLIEGNGIGIQNPFGPNTTIGLKPNILLGPAGSLHVLNQNSTAVAGISTNNQGGFLTLSNVQGTQTFGVSNFSDGQPFLTLNSRLGRQVVEMKANEFSDGEINLKSVLTNTVIRLTSNDNAGGLINVFNSIGNIAAQLRSDINNEGRLLLNSPNNVRVLDLSTNSAGGGLLRLFNVEGTEALRLTTFETYGGSVRVANRAGLVAARLNATTIGDGNLSIFDKNEQEAAYLSINNNGGGFLGIRNGENSEVARLSTLPNSQPRLRLSNRLGGPVADLRANDFSDGELQLYAVLNNPTLQLKANAGGGGLINVFNPIEGVAAVLTDDGGGYFGIFNVDQTEMIQLRILEDRNARVRVNNRLSNPSADLFSNEFSDGELRLYSVLNNPTVRVTANDNAGGLINIFNQGGKIAASLTEITGGHFTLFNSEEAEMIQIGTLEDGNGLIRVNNRLGTPVADLMSTTFSDGQLTLGSVLGNRTVLLTANDNAGGLINVFNQNRSVSAQLTESDGDGLFKIFNRDSQLVHHLFIDGENGGLFEIKSKFKFPENVAEIGGNEDDEGHLYLFNRDSKAAVYLSAAGGDGDLGLSDIDGKIKTSLSGSRYGGTLSIRNENNEPVHFMGSNGKTKEGFYSIFNKSDINKNRLSMGGDSLGNGYLNVFNFNGLNTFFMGHNQFADGVISIKNNLGNLGALFEALKDGGSVTVTDGKPGTNHRGVLLNGLNGGKLSLFNNQTKLVNVISVGDNGEGLWQIVSKQDITKNRIEMGGDNAGAGYSIFYNNNALKTADIGAMGDASGFMSTYSASGKRQTLISSANNGGGVSIFNSSDKIIGSLNTASNQGGEMNIYNVSGSNTSKLSNGGSGAGMLEIGTSAGVKVARVTTLDGTGYIGLDNVDKKEVVRITANLGKGGGIGLKNAALFDMINLTQDNNFGAILINNATGGLMTNITHNTAGGAFIGTKDQNGKDAIWLTTGLQGGGHFTAFNTLGKNAINLMVDANNIGTLSAHGSAGNELVRVSGTSNGVGLVSIFNGSGTSLAGLTSGSPSGAGYIYVQNLAGKELARMTTTADGTAGRISIDNSNAVNIAGLTSSAAGGYVFANANNGKEIARMASYTSADGFVSVSNSSSAEIAFLSTSTNKAGYIGVANPTGGERARIFTANTGGGYVGVNNPAGTEVARLTYGGTNNGIVQTSNSTGTILSTIGSTPTNQGYVGVNSSAGSERVYMTNQDFGGELGVRDPSGNRRVFLSGAGSLTVTDTEGSYFNASAFGNGVQLFFVDKLQHPRMEVGAGFVSSKGPNGGESSFLSNLVGSPHLGFVGVRNSSVFEGATEAGMFVNTSGQGVIFADVKNFKMDYPGKPDKQIWYGSLEGPELAAYIRGTGKLTNGKASIEFTDHYQNVANTGTMTVILTPLSG